MASRRKETRNDTIIFEGQRATTDKNDLFLNMEFKHGKKWADKNGAKCKKGSGV